MDPLLWFPLWAKEYLGDPKVQAMSVEREGILLRLWCYCWDAGALPNRADVLRRLCKNEVSIEAINEVLRDFFELSDDGSTWTSARLEEERQGAVDRRARQRERTKAAPEARQLRRTLNVTSNVTSDVTTHVTSSSSPSPSPSPTTTAAAGDAIADLNLRIAEHPLATRVFQAMSELPWEMGGLARCALNALEGLGTTGGKAASVEDLVAGFVELAGSEIALNRQPFKPAAVMTWISNAMRRRAAAPVVVSLSAADRLKARREALGGARAS
jgi:uncharacterized protein YdaU (DUF1376 family)